MRTPLHSRNGKKRRPRRAVDRHQSATTATEETPQFVDPLAPIIAHLNELREFSTYYLSVRYDKWRMRVRSALFYSLVAVIAALIIVTSLVTATILVWRGVAAAVKGLCGEQPWLGDLIAGGSILFVAFGATWLWARRRTVEDLRKIMARYESQKQTEQEELGMDIAERAQLQNDQAAK